MMNPALVTIYEDIASTPTGLAMLAMHTNLKRLLDSHDNISTNFYVRVYDTINCLSAKGGVDIGLFHKLIDVCEINGHDDELSDRVEADLYGEKYE
jgi:hypothetical protein